MIPARFASWARSPFERLADRRGHLAGPAVVHHRVADPAHQVLAEPDLRVHHAGAREDGAVAEVREVAGDRRRADVDRDAVGLVVEPGPDAGDRRACRGPRPSRRTCPASSAGWSARITWRSASRSVELPLALERHLEPVEVAGRRRELGRLDLDVMEPDDRVEVEVADVEALPDDLAVDLALGRDVDDDVAPEVGRAAEPPLVGEALAVAVLGLDRAERASGGRAPR